MPKSDYPANETVRDLLCCGDFVHGREASPPSNRRPYADARPKPNMRGLKSFNPRSAFHEIFQSAKRINQSHLLNSQATRCAQSG
jgi:hypothetical protein